MSKSVARSKDVQVYKGPVESQGSRLWSCAYDVQVLIEMSTKGILLVDVDTEQLKHGWRLIREVNGGRGFLCWQPDWDSFLQRGEADQASRSVVKPVSKVGSSGAKKLLVDVKFSAFRSNDDTSKLVYRGSVCARVRGEVRVYEADWRGDSQVYQCGHGCMMEDSLRPCHGDCV